MKTRHPMTLQHPVACRGIVHQHDTEIGCVHSTRDCGEELCHDICGLVRKKETDGWIDRETVCMTSAVGMCMPCMRESAVGQESQNFVSQGDFMLRTYPSMYYTRWSIHVLHHKTNVSVGAWGGGGFQPQILPV